MLTADRCRETTTTTGTGDITLGGAATAPPSKAFSAVFADGDQVEYCIMGQTGSTEFEVGLGQFNSAANSITRSTVLSSSNANALVNFSAGTKDVIATVAAQSINSMVRAKLVTFAGPQGSSGALVTLASRVFAAKELRVGDVIRGSFYSKFTLGTGSLGPRYAVVVNSTTVAGESTASATTDAGSWVKFEVGIIGAASQYNSATHTRDTNGSSSFMASVASTANINTGNVTISFKGRFSTVNGTATMEAQYGYIELVRGA